MKCALHAVVCDDTWGPGRHRVETQGLALSLRSLARLAKMKNPEAPAVKREAEQDWGLRAPRYSSYESKTENPVLF
jgi:hypothetical protein